MKLTKDKIEKLLKTAKGKKIMVVGDIMVDEFLYGRVERISPEAPVPVLEFSRTEFMPGGAANAANNIHDLGGTPLLAGYIGDDVAGERLVSELKLRNITTEGLMINNQRPTMLKTRVVAHQQQVVRIDREKKGYIDKECEDRLKDFIDWNMKHVDAVLICDYIKGTVTPGILKSLIRIAKKLDKPVITDTKAADLTPFKGITLLTPNVIEAEKLAAFPIENEADLKVAGERLNRLLGSKAILITRAEQGMTLVPEKGKLVNLPALASQVSDVTGAGDTVAAALTLLCASGASFEEAAYIANLAAGVVVRKLGTATATPHELLHLFEEAEIERR